MLGKSDNRLIASYDLVVDVCGCLLYSYLTVQDLRWCRRGDSTDEAPAITPPPLAARSRASALRNVGDLDHAGAFDYLRGGVFLCGGGSRIPRIAELAGQILQMPASVGKTNSISGLKSALDQPEFATPIGLVKFGSFQQRKRVAKGSLADGIKTTIGQLFRRGYNP